MPLINLFTSSLRFRVAAIAFCVVAGLGGCQTQPSFVNATLFDEVRARNDEMEAKLRSGDKDGVAAIYADDGLLLSPSGNRVEGRQAIDAYWKQIGDPVDWELSIATLEGTSNIMHQRGTSRLTLVRSGEERTSVVDFVLVWIRDDEGQLRIAVDAYWPSEPK